MIKRTRLYKKQRIVNNNSKSEMVSTVNDRSIWDLIKEYVNQFPIDHIIERGKIILAIYQMKESYVNTNSIDSYLYQLRYVQVLETIKPGKYKKLRNIPVNLTTSHLSKVSKKNSWESWFMTIDYV